MPSSPSQSLFLSSTSSLSPNINKTPISSMKPYMKGMPDNKKEGKYKRKMTEETDEVEKSFINFSSVVTQHG